MTSGEIKRRRNAAYRKGFEDGRAAASTPSLVQLLVGSRIAELEAALELAIDHIEHMAAFIGQNRLGYSFESLGEDMPGIKAAHNASIPTPIPDDGDARAPLPGPSSRAHSELEPDD